MQGIHQFAVRHSQRGVTLVVGMIMLVLITLLVLAGFHLGRNNLDIVGKNDLFVFLTANDQHSFLPLLYVLTKR